jgi:hypothetical protein
MARKEKREVPWYSTRLEELARVALRAFLDAMITS